MCWLLELTVEEELLNITTVEFGSVDASGPGSSGRILLVHVKSFDYPIDSFLTAHLLICLVVLSHLGSLHLSGRSLILEHFTYSLHFWLRGQVPPLER